MGLRQSMMDRAAAQDAALSLQGQEPQGQEGMPALGADQMAMQAAPAVDPQLAIEMEDLMERRLLKELFAKNRMKEIDNEVQALMQERMAELDDQIAKIDNPNVKKPGKQR